MSLILQIMPYDIIILKKLESKNTESKKNGTQNRRKKKPISRQRANARRHRRQRGYSRFRKNIEGGIDTKPYQEPSGFKPGQSPLNKQPVNKQEKCNENSKSQAERSGSQSEGNQNQLEGSQGQSSENRHHSERSCGQSESSCGRSESSQGQSERSHGQSERSHGQSESSRGQSERSRGQSERSRGQSERSPDQSERSHGQAESSRSQSESSHSQSEILIASLRVFVASLRDLVASLRDLMASPRDPRANQRDLVASQRDLVASQRDLVANQCNLCGHLQSHYRHKRFKLIIGKNPNLPMKYLIRIQRSPEDDRSSVRENDRRHESQYLELCGVFVCLSAMRQEDFLSPAECCPSASRWQHSTCRRAFHQPTNTHYKNKKHIQTGELSKKYKKRKSGKWPSEDANDERGGGQKAEKGPRRAN
ncbi:leucine zipper protein 4 [Meles meles]|uniref:leucine zipper protein 4 n=1 Tax=Meles meles TaxID=9662 RepID=UPI001E69BEF3|nr:leucine zipper protein 4 [Meles meles]